MLQASQDYTPYILAYDATLAATLAPSRDPVARASAMNSIRTSYENLTPADKLWFQLTCLAMQIPRLNAEGFPMSPTASKTAIETRIRQLYAELYPTQDLTADWLTPHLNSALQQYEHYTAMRAEHESVMPATEVPVPEDYDMFSVPTVALPPQPLRIDDPFNQVAQTSLRLPEPFITADFLTLCQTSTAASSLERFTCAIKGVSWTTVETLRANGAIHCTAFPVVIRDNGALLAKGALAFIAVSTRPVVITQDKASLFQAYVHKGATYYSNFTQLGIAPAVFQQALSNVPVFQDHTVISLHIADVSHLSGKSFGLALHACLMGFPSFAYTGTTGFEKDSHYGVDDVTLKLQACTEQRRLLVALTPQIRDKDTHLVPERLVPFAYDATDVLNGLFLQSHTKTLIIAENVSTFVLFVLSQYYATNILTIKPPKLNAESVNSMTTEQLIEQISLSPNVQLRLGDKWRSKIALDANLRTSAKQLLLSDNLKHIEAPVTASSEKDAVISKMHELCREIRKNLSARQEAMKNSDKSDLVLKAPQMNNMLAQIEAMTGNTNQAVKKLRETLATLESIVALPLNGGPRNALSSARPTASTGAFGW